MKRYLTLILFVLSAMQINAQQTNGLDNAKKSFIKSYPAATNIKWSKEDNEYEVDFILTEKKMSAIYDSTGNLKETEQAIAATELPSSIMPYFNQHYKNVPIKETAKISKSGREVNYEIGIKGKDILFDATGKFIKEAKD